MIDPERSLSIKRTGRPVLPNHPRNRLAPGQRITCPLPLHAKTVGKVYRRGLRSQGFGRISLNMLRFALSARSLLSMNESHIDSTRGRK